MPHLFYLSFCFSYNLQMNFAHLLHIYGYLMIFLVTALNLSTVILLAGFAAHSGYLDFYWTVLVGFLGTLFFSEVYFLLARYGMGRFLITHPKCRVRIERFNQKFKSNRAIIFATFFYRFIPGFRVLTPFLVAPLKVPFLGVTIANALGSFVWSVIFVCVGYYFGALADRFLADVKAYEWYVVAAIILLMVLSWLAHHYYKKYTSRS